MSEQQWNTTYYGHHGPERVAFRGHRIVRAKSARHAVEITKRWVRRNAARPLHTFSVAAFQLEVRS